MPLYFRALQYLSHTKTAVAGKFPLTCLALFAAMSMSSFAEPTDISESDSMEAILWLGDMTSARQKYETAVIQLALEKTRDEYGEYRFRVNGDPLSNPRVEREIRTGETVNLISSPNWMGHDDEEDSPLKVIPIPISRGLLGYRQLVVRKQDLPRFANVQTIADLGTLAAGIGDEWIDKYAFADNQLEWYAGGGVEQLLAMLARARFDYLPLGIVEAEQVLTNSHYSDEFAIVPELLIYYPLPVYLQVSILEQRLEERLEQGLRAAEADGSLDALFDQHYGHIVEQLRPNNTRVITLENL